MGLSITFSPAVKGAGEQCAGGGGAVQPLRARRPRRHKVPEVPPGQPRAAPGDGGSLLRIPIPIAVRHPHPHSHPDPHPHRRSPSRARGGTPRLRYLDCAFKNFLCALMAC